MLREWDLARAARAKKVGFWTDIEDIFLFFEIEGGARDGDYWDYACPSHKARTTETGSYDRARQLACGYAILRTGQGNN